MENSAYNFIEWYFRFVWLLFERKFIRFHKMNENEITRYVSIVVHKYLLDVENECFCSGRRMNVGVKAFTSALTAYIDTIN